MTVAPSEVSIADPKRLLALGEKLFEEAYELPDTIATVAVGGTDPLSRAIAGETSEFVESAINGSRVINDANNLIDAAKAVLGDSTGDGARKDAEIRCVAALRLRPLAGRSAWELGGDEETVTDG